jgi:hypothetical protein
MAASPGIAARLRVAALPVSTSAAPVISAKPAIWTPSECSISAAGPLMLHRRPDIVRKLHFGEVSLAADLRTLEI